MKILQISFHTAPFGTAGKYDSGGLNVYVEKISEQLSKNNDVTAITAEKSESFIKDNLEFKSFNLFDQNLSVEDKEIYLQDFSEILNKEINLKSFDVIHSHYWLSGLVGKQIANKLKARQKAANTLDTIMGAGIDNVAEKAKNAVKSAFGSFSNLFASPNKS